VQQVGLNAPGPGKVLRLHPLGMAAASLNAHFRLELFQVLNEMRKPGFCPHFS
jgi:hypothetical protein